MSRWIVASRTMASALTVGLWITNAIPVAAESRPGGTASENTNAGIAAIDQAAHANKHLYVFFWKNNDQCTQNGYEVFEEAMAGLTETADSVTVQIDDVNEKPIVDKFDVSRAPMPLVLALAPNGAVTKGWPIRFTVEQLEEGIVSPATANCLKALQAQKLVLVCVHNEQTRFSQAAWHGVQAFGADRRFAKATEVVAVDPRDEAEAKFLSDLRVDPRTPQAVTVLLAPPGAPIATFPGAVTKNQIVAKVTAAGSGCCPGGKCGPGGCCPK